MIEDLKAIIEALILASETPLSVKKMAEIIGEENKELLHYILREIVTEYEERNGGICLQEVGGGFQFRTKSDLAQWVRKLKGIRYSLTPAALEILAIVAYRQPVVKSEIDNIRGVDGGGPLRRLLEKKLIRIVGRKDVPGKPIIYGTTKHFLEVFDLRDLSELPTLQEFKELLE